MDPGRCFCRAPDLESEPVWKYQAQSQLCQKQEEVRLRFVLYHQQLHDLAKITFCRSMSRIRTPWQSPFGIDDEIPKIPLIFNARRNYRIVLRIDKGAWVGHTVVLGRCLL